jgi:hypothetical protein
LRDDIPRIRAAGAELVVIGNGSPEQARWFVEDTGIESPVFTEPDLVLFRELGLRRGLAAVLDPRIFARAWRALRRGFRQNGVKGDPTQLGGVFVIRRGGSILYEYRSRFAGDYPAGKDFLERLEAEALSP